MTSKGSTIVPVVAPTPPPLLTYHQLTWEPESATPVYLFLATIGLHQLDIRKVFLHGKLDEVMDQLPCFIISITHSS